MFLSTADIIPAIVVDRRYEATVLLAPGVVRLALVPAEHRRDSGRKTVGPVPVTLPVIF